MERLFPQWAADVGVLRWGEFEGAGGEVFSIRAAVMSEDAVAFWQGEGGFGNVEVGVQKDDELLDDPLQVAFLGGEDDAVSFVAMAVGFEFVEFLDLTEVEPGGKGGHGVVEHGSLAEGIQLGFLEVGIVKPKDFAVADRQAGAVAGELATEFVRGLKGDGAFANDGLLKEMGTALFHELGREGGVLRFEGIEA